MKLKLKLKWNVDLVPRIKNCKPRPVSEQKEAKLGKQDPSPADVMKHHNNRTTIDHSVDNLTCY